jgi:hypothetical protein
LVFGRACRPFVPEHRVSEDEVCLSATSRRKRLLSFGATEDGVCARVEGSSSSESTARERREGIEAMESCRGEAVVVGVVDVVV